MTALRRELRKKEQEIGELKKQLDASQGKLKRAQASLGQLDATKGELGEQGYQAS